MKLYILASWVQTCCQPWHIDVELGTDPVSSPASGTTSIESSRGNSAPICPIEAVQGDH